MRLIAAFIALALAPAAAMGQTRGAGEGLELYDYPNFQGASVTVAREVPNLGPGGFDDMTTSIAVRSGAWEICSAPGFAGVCRTIDSDVWDLEALGLNNQVSSIRPARAADPAPGPLPPVYGGGEDRARLVLYEGTGFRGVSASYYDRADNLRLQNFENRAGSAEVDGAWILCEGANLSGRCQEVTGDIADLGRIGMAGSVSSAAPTGGGPDYGGPYRPGPGAPYEPYPGAERSLEGEGAIFFPRPDMRRAALGGCLAGDRRACEREVDRFCRAQPGGWREGAYYTRDLRAGTLTDVLCVR